MSVESFTIVSLEDEFLVDLMAGRLEKTVEYHYPYQRCIAQIELQFRDEYKERAYHEINQMPNKSTHYDEELQRFVDEGKILLKTDHFEFTIYPHNTHSIRIKKHPHDNTCALPFEESDVPPICEGLTHHHIDIPGTLEVDLIENIRIGKESKLSKTISYPAEEGVVADVKKKVKHAVWNFFTKTQ